MGHKTKETLWAELEELEGWSQSGNEASMARAAHRADSLLRAAGLTGNLMGEFERSWAGQIADTSRNGLSALQSALAEPPPGSVVVVGADGSASAEAPPAPPPPPPPQTDPPA